MRLINFGMKIMMVLPLHNLKLPFLVWLKITLITLLTMIFISCAASRPEKELGKQQIENPYESEVYKGHRKKVAVAQFANNTRFGKRRLGENISDVLITELGKTDRFILLERARVDKILDQVAFSQTGITEGNIDEIQLLDADYIIVGAVTQYSVNTTGSRGLFTQSKTQTAEVVADMRMINIRTGEIVMSESGRGAAERTFEKVLGMGEDGGYDESLEMHAFRNAVVRMTVNIVHSLEDEPFFCDVVEIDGNKLYLDAGENSNLAIGDEVIIFSKGEDIKNLSGKLLGFKKELVSNGKIVDFIGSEGAVVVIDSNESLSLPLICQVKK